MQGPRLYILTTIQIVAVLLLLRFLLMSSAPWNAGRYIGTALVLLGIGGIVWARRELGNSFSVTAQARVLVTSGIYSKIRNPIYVFGCVALAGLFLILHRSALWILLLVVAIGQIIRARREARVLEAAFGDAYREYRRKTWF